MVTYNATLNNTDTDNSANAAVPRCLEMKVVVELRDEDDVARPSISSLSGRVTSAMSAVPVMRNRAVPRFQPADCDLSSLLLCDKLSAMFFRERPADLQD